MNVEDTSKRDPIEHVGGALAQGPTGYIEGMEAAGQQQIVNSTKIPRIGIADEELEALGFKLAPKTEDDELFRDCELPEGWSREGSDHSMWSYIVDERGYRRIGVFYKAAYYDRRADMHIEREPRTRAQEEVWEQIDPGHDKWRGGDSHRDGDNYVYVWWGRYGDDGSPPEGKHAYSDDGRRLEVVVAPNGDVLSRREYTTEPVESEL